MDDLVGTVPLVARVSEAPVDVDRVRGGGEERRIGLLVVAW
ncbi:MAG: hypothetical protein M0014_05175 [Actinomycetota bacterium]|nr:hypothetical protein [Actinomycetota bacterium]